MARRADHRPEELKKLAIAAGMELVRQGGPAGLSGRKVAAAIGYTVGTIYNVFGSYDLYRLHLNAVILDEWYEALTAMLGQQQSENAIELLARFYMAYSHEHASQWRLLFDDSQPAPEHVPHWYQEKIARLFGLLEQVVQQTMHCPPAQAKCYAEVLWAGVHGIAALSLSGKLSLVKAEEADKLVLSFMQIFSKGVAA